MAAAAREPPAEHNHMMKIEPEELLFTSVRLNQVYTQCVRITNPMPWAVDIEISPGSDRFAVQPSHVQLPASGQALIEVRLHLRKPIPKPRKAKEVAYDCDHMHRDIFHVRSSFFQQKFFALISLWGSTVIVPHRLDQVMEPSHKNDTIPPADSKKSMEAVSPKTDKVIQNAEVLEVEHKVNAKKLTLAYEEELIHAKKENDDLRRQLSSAKDECEFLTQKANSFDTLTRTLSSKSPAIAAMVDIIVEREREDNEFKNKKVLSILKAKDDTISNLQHVLDCKLKDLNVKIASVDDLQNEKAALQAELFKIRQLLTSATENIAVKEADLQEQQELLRAHMEDNFEMSKASAEKVQLLERDNVQLSASLKACQHELRERKANGDPQQLKSLIEQLNNDLTRAQEEHKNKIGEMHAMADKSAIQIAEIASHKEFIKRLKSEATTMKKEIENLNIVNSGLSSDIVSLQAKVQDAEASILFKDSKISELKKIIEDDRENVSTSNVARLRSQLAESLEVNAQLQSDIDKLQSLQSIAQASLLNHEKKLHCISTRDDNESEHPTLLGIRKAISTLYNQLHGHRGEVAAAASHNLLEMLSSISLRVAVMEANLQTSQISCTTFKNQMSSIQISHLRQISHLEDAIREKTELLRIHQVKAPLSKEISSLHSDNEDSELTKRYVALQAQVDQIVAQESKRNSMQELHEQETENARQLLALSNRLQQEVHRLRAIIYPDFEAHSVNTWEKDLLDSMEHIKTHRYALIKENETLRLELERSGLKVHQLQCEKQQEISVCAEANKVIIELERQLHIVNISETLVSEPIEFVSSKRCESCSDLLVSQMNSFQIEKQSDDIDVNQVSTDSKIENTLTRRIFALESELDECKSHVEVLLKTTEALQSGEENRVIRDKNACIIAIAAQLSTTKTLECSANRRLRDLSIDLWRLQKSEMASQATITRMRAKNLSLQKLLHQASLDKNEQVKRTRKQHSQIELLRRRTLEMKKMSSLVSSMRHEMRETEERFTAALAKKGSGPDRIEDVEFSRCLTCDAVINDYSKTIDTRIDSIISSIQKSLDSENAPRLVTIVESVRKDAIQLSRLLLETEQNNCIVKHKYVDLKQRNCALRGIYETVKTELKISNKIIAELRTDVSMVPVTLDYAGPEQANVGGEESSNWQIPLLKAEIISVAHQRDRIQRQLELSTIKFASEIATAEQNIRNSISQKVTADLSSLERSVELMLRPIVDADPSNAAVVLGNQIVACKAVEMQLLDRIDVLMRSNENLVRESLSYQHLSDNLESQLLEKEDTEINNHNHLHDHCVARIRDLEASAEALRSPPPDSHNRRVLQDIRWNEELPQKETSLTTDENLDHNVTTNIKKWGSPSHKLSPSLKASKFGDGADSLSHGSSVFPKTPGFAKPILKKQHVHRSSQTQEREKPLKKSHDAEQSTIPVDSGPEQPHRKVDDCSLKDVAFARSTLRKMNGHVNALLNACDNVEFGSTAKVLHFRNEVKTEAFQIGLSWRQMEPTICNLCDERTKLAAGVEMVRTQMQELRMMKSKTSPEKQLRSESSNTECMLDCCNAGVNTDAIPPQCTSECTMEKQKLEEFLEKLQKEKSALALQNEGAWEICSRLQKNVDELERGQQESNVPRQPVNLVSTSNSESQTESGIQKGNAEKKKHKVLKAKYELVVAELRIAKEKAFELESGNQSIKSEFLREQSRLLKQQKVAAEKERNEAVKNAITSSSEEINLLKSHLSREIAIHTQQFEALLNEFERYRDEHEKVVAAYEADILSMKTSQGKPQVKQTLQNPNEYYSESSLECGDCGAARHELERVREQLLASKSLCRTLRRQIRVNDLRQQSTPSVPVSRSVSPSSSSQRKISKLESRLQQYRIQVQTLTDTINVASSQTEVVNLTHRVEELVKTIEMKEKKLKESSQFIINRDRIIADLRQRLQRLTEAKNDVKEASSSVHEKMHSLAGDLSRKTALLKDATSKIDELQSQIADQTQLREALRRTKNMLQRKETSLNTLQQQLETIKQSNQELEESIKLTTSQLEELKKDNQRLKKTVAVSSKRSERLQSIIARFSSELAGASERVAAQVGSENMRAPTTSRDNASLDPLSLSQALPEFSTMELEDLLSVSVSVSPARSVSDCKSDCARIKPLLNDLSDPSVIVEGLMVQVAHRVSLERELFHLLSKNHIGVDDALPNIIAS
uniref:Uncharacterized protein n=1 Tax=Spongospora subterranea TaxID=70186 RepID=A0A0H5QUP6_9EUKA|eukprot:CRZ05472.1 hypothetical protein [Spongospora subterranea]